ncbi:hypothetical protein CRG98_030815, partial [Punica granatum]
SRSKHHSDDAEEEDDSDSEATATVENGSRQVKKVKLKNPMKPKVTVAKAAAKIDAANLSAFLVGN